MPPGPHNALCVRGTRTSLGRAGRTAYRGYHPRLTPQRPPHTPRHTVRNIPGYHPIGPLVITPGTARPSCAYSSSTVPSQADTCAPGPTHYCAYGLRVPASHAVYAQCTYRRRRAACPQGPTHCTYTVRTYWARVPDSGALRAYRGAPGVFFGWVIYLSLLLNEGDAEADGEAA